MLTADSKAPPGHSAKFFICVYPRGKAAKLIRHRQHYEAPIVSFLLAVSPSAHVRSGGDRRLGDPFMKKASETIERGHDASWMWRRGRKKSQTMAKDLDYTPFVHASELPGGC